MSWFALVAIAGVALCTIVVVDLRRTIDEQTMREQALAQQAAERAARALRARLGEAAVTEQLVPDTARFVLVDGTARSEPPVAVDPGPAFDPENGLDALAQERVRRASLAAPADALAELAPLIDDRSLGRDARAWLRDRMAWIAHRGGLTAERDALLGDDTADASSIVLRAELGTLSGTALERAFAALAGHVEPGRARLLIDRLASLGIATERLRARLAAVTERRATLRHVEPHVGTLIAAREPRAELVDDGLLLFWPDVARGAWLSIPAARTLGEALRTDDEQDAAIATPPFPPTAIPIVDDLLAAAPTDVPQPSLLAGPTGTALLIAALALVCGAGSLLAFRALRREGDAMRARADFLTTVTHELKTPLAGVRLVAELLADDHITDVDERRTWLGRLNAEAVRLGVLIENVLDLGRLDRGERPHAPETVDVAELVAETVAIFAPLAERDGIAVELARPEAPLLADVDPGTLRQALLNVLDNARKYGRSPLEVAVHDRVTSVEIVVRDHGDGVGPAERDAIFDRFHRGAAHAHGSIPGVGLGLHLARAIALRHQGELEHSTPAGGGASFAFRLPVATEAER